MGYTIAYIDLAPPQTSADGVILLYAGSTHQLLLNGNHPYVEFGGAFFTPANSSCSVDAPVAFGAITRGFNGLLSIDVTFSEAGDYYICLIERAVVNAVRTVSATVRVVGFPPPQRPPPLRPPSPPRPPSLPPDIMAP